MWRFRTGSPWRDLLAEYGPWSPLYDRFRSWTTAGVFGRLMQAVISEAAARGQADLDLVSADSTTVRAHCHAAAMVVDGAVVKALEEAAEQEKGLRQRGTTPRPANPAKTGTGTGTGMNAGGYNGGAEYG
ncbi:hypothetical protein Aros01_09071 [Streptosporangium roseum]